MATVLLACQGGDRAPVDARSQPVGETPTPTPTSSSAAGPATTSAPDPGASPTTAPSGPGATAGAPDPPTSTAAPANPGPGPVDDPTPPSAPPRDQPGDLLLSSGFEQEVCGNYFQELDPGCEFGIQGDVETGAFGARTGPQALRINRQSPTHMGVIAVRPLPGGHAFTGVAHRVPAIPVGAIEAGGYIQLQQISPTDGSLPGYTVEVRLYSDRRLGLALFRGEEIVKTTWAAPVDAWFYVVVEVVNGARATQRMWVYDSGDRLVDEVAVDLPTRQSWEHEGRTAQKVGGTRSTLVPMFTYADDWFISTGFRGPTRIGGDGKVLA